MPTATVTTIAAGTYRSDPVHSNVSFTVRHFGAGKFRGGFAEAQATLNVSDSGELELAGDVEAASVDVKEPHLAAHLKSPDFFDAERYPKISFRSTDVAVGDDGTLEIDGDLTIKATTKRVHASGEITYSPADPEGNPRVGIELSTTIDRIEFGVDFAAQLPGGIPVVGNEVTLIAELELRKVDEA